MSSKLLATKRWICDTCFEWIGCAEQGSLEWTYTQQNGSGTVGREIKIVHHVKASQLKGGCSLLEGRENSESVLYSASIHLDQLVGQYAFDGLVRLLQFTEENQFPPQTINIIIMRLFVPGYEDARRFLRRAADDEVIDRGNPDGYLTQSEIAAILQRKYADVRD